MTGSTAVGYVDRSIAAAFDLLRESEMILRGRDWERLRGRLNEARTEIERTVDDLDRSMDILIVDNQSPDDTYPES